MMELAPLRSFLAIAREGHLTRAARALHLSQPAVSAQLARLEEDLGASLFHRTPKGMQLTKAGELFRTYAEQGLLFLEDGREALDALRGLQRGTLSVGGGATATTYLLPPVLRRFHEAHSAIQLYVREAGSAAVVEGVLAGDLDLGVVTLPVDTRGGGLVVTPWQKDDLRLVVPPGHRLSKRRRFRWTELDGEPLVLFEGGTAVRRVIDAALDE
ncbi:MAG: LysR family transcriptional regulator, partial [Proteobacteria bacterium]|nr:LysR family transcriptional regulator [Pseudomonadota bacterium]